MTTLQAGQIGFLTGLKAEAALLRPFRGVCPVAIGGATAAGAEAAVERLLRAGVRTVVSFGVAAGLSPDLRPGDLLVPEQVVVDGRVLETDPVVAGWLGGDRIGSLLHSARVVASAAEKRRLYAETGCRALDMESGIAASAAQAAGLSFAALRAICDPADRDLPPACAVAIRPGGEIDAVALAGSLLRRPKQIGGLLAVGRDAAAARKALSVKITLIARQNLVVIAGGGR